MFAKSEDELQQMLNVIHSWCKRWKVLINTDKSKCVHFRKGRKKQSEFNFSIGNNALKTVDDYKYLGVTFNCKGSFNLHAETLAKGAGRALGKIISKIHSLKDFGFQSYEKLFNSCVTPILDYASGIWGNRKFQSIDNVQNRAIRYYLGVHRFAPILALYGDTGWIPSQFRHWVNIIRYWNRLLSFEDDRLTKVVFNMDYDRCTNNWCSDTKDIFTKLNMLHYYESRTMVDLKSFEQIVRTYYSDIWRESLINKPKLRSYLNFKTNFELEHYVKLNLTKHERSVLAQFRCGLLPIRIETGRYIGEPVENRLCRFCNSQNVESELHFLINCTFYNDIRQTVFSEILMVPDFTQLDEQGKLTFLMVNHPRKIAKYLAASLFRRKQTVYSS